MPFRIRAAHFLALGLTAVAAAALSAAQAKDGMNGSRVIEPSRASSPALKATDAVDSGYAAKLHGTRTAITMREGATHEGPPAHRAFCERSPEACELGAERQPGAFGTLSDADLRELEAFNGSVNHAFAPRSDRKIYGVSDYWTLPTTEADCEDYALYKRARLIEAGWPPEAVLIGVVHSKVQGYHAVLIIRTNRGELVLDNLRDDIVSWRDTGYEWVIRQSTKDPRRWVEIENGVIAGSS